METNITRRRELTIRYCVKRDDNGQPLTLGRTLSGPRESAELLVPCFTGGHLRAAAASCATLAPTS